MGDRKKIGIIYEYNENWIGGTYYIQNLISSLNFEISNDRKPDLYIYTEKDEHFNQLKSITQYPFVKRGSYFAKRNVLQKLINKISKLLFNKEPYSYLNKEADIVFPAHNKDMFRPGQKLLYWIPDFQEHYLPAFFSEEEIKSRKEYQLSIAIKNNNILFSSQSVKNDFNEIYPDSKVNQFVLPFAVVQSNKNDLKDCRSKYGITDPYFICCNQFWKHKNHLVVLKAIGILKKSGKNVHVVFTGKEHDYRNLEYFNDLKATVQLLNIEDCVSFLGFIDREEQLSLIRLAVAIIQPSMFEGWSTVIEDGKSLNARVLASDINVHKEQLQNYPVGSVFNLNDPEQLASKMLALLGNNISGNVYDYNLSIKDFAVGFMKIISSI